MQRLKYQLEHKFVGCDNHFRIQGTTATQVPVITRVIWMSDQSGHYCRNKNYGATHQLVR